MLLCITHGTNLTGRSDIPHQTSFTKDMESEIHRFDARGTEK